jgi:flagellar motor switch protein FliG
MNEQITMQNIKPLEKAALVLVAMGVDNASAILKNLSETEVENLSVEIARMKNVSEEVLNSVMEDFYQMMTANQYMVQSGINYTKQVLEKAWGKKKAEELIKRVEAETEISAFYLLQTVDDKHLLNFLQNEHPQTSALILANLKPAQAASILSELPEENQYEVAYRLATIEKTAPELVEDIEDVLREQMGSVFGSSLSKTGGPEAVAEILNSVNRTSEKNILNNLRERDAELAAEITAFMFIFEDLVLLPDSSIQRILKDIDSKTLALSMKTATTELREKIFKNMSERAASMLKEELEYLGPVKVKDVENAQKEILEAAHALEAAGEISLSRGEEEEIVE